MNAAELMEKLLKISPDWRFGFGQCVDGKFVKGNPLPVWENYRNENKSVMKFLDAATPDVLDECPILDFRISFGKEVFKDKHQTQE